MSDEQHTFSIEEDWELFFPSYQERYYSVNGGPYIVTVRINSFEFMKYPVSHTVYLAVMGENPSYYRHAKKTSSVENVSWNEATLFCEKLSSITGLHFRLPTVKEWYTSCPIVGWFPTSLLLEWSKDHLFEENSGSNDSIVLCTPQSAMAPLAPIFSRKDVKSRSIGFRCVRDLY